jgi:hypothetical protein
MGKLPDFVVIGASKCGTSSLHEYLRQHPHISLPVRKETHFFIYDRASEQMHDDDIEMTNRIEVLEEYLADFEPKEEPVTHGEVDPKYIVYPNAAHNIKKYIPKAKLACLLRNPVDRFYSSFHFLRLKRSDLGGFGEVVDSIRNGQLDIHTKRALEASYYFKHLQHYYDCFPKEQIRIFLFDDLAKRPRMLMKSFLEYIEVDQFDFNLEKKFNPSGQARFGWIYKALRDSPTAYFLRKHLPRKMYQFARLFGEKIMIRPYSPMPETDRKFLQNIFREDIERLQESTGMDLSTWLV